MLLIELWALILSVMVYHPLRAQFPRTSPQYAEQMYQEEKDLVDAVLALQPALNTFLYPESALLSVDGYRFDYPLTTVYRINLVVDPCRGARADCCMNVYGVAEYPSLLRNGLEAERQVIYPVIGNSTEVGINFALVYEDSSPVPAASSRFADDSTVVDPRCRSFSVPYSFCQSKNYAYQRSPSRPACLDNNQTLDAAAGCTGPDNVTRPLCVTVAYTQTAFIPQCGLDNGHCGTYLEIHQKMGSFYHPENFPIASTKIETRNVSGYYTTVLPLTFDNNYNRILCAYTESYVRVGSIVYIKPSAPVCCCPEPFKPATRVGSWECPVGASGPGSTASVPINLAETLLMEVKNNAYPFCPIDVTSPRDFMMYSAYDEVDKRHYLRSAALADRRDSSGLLNLGTFKYGSDDLYGWVYDGPCEYYPSCALTLDNGLCKGGDVAYHFIGKVGIVTDLDDKALIPTVQVSFNRGRTSYKFLKSDVKLELSKSMYEIWWVVKTPTGNVVQKRKGFNITSPTCTLDSINNRYFPYTILATDPKDGSIKMPYRFLDSATSFD